MIFPENDYNTTGSFTMTDGKYTFTHAAYGADMFRYSWNYGKNWTTWANWEDVTTVPDKSVFQNSDNFWDGDHIQVQCESTLCIYFTLRN